MARSLRRCCFAPSRSRPTPSPPSWGRASRASWPSTAPGTISEVRYDLALDVIARSTARPAGGGQVPPERRRRPDHRFPRAGASSRAHGQRQRTAGRRRQRRPHPCPGAASLAAGRTGSSSGSSRHRAQRRQHHPLPRPGRQTATTCTPCWFRPTPTSSSRASTSPTSRPASPSRLTTPAGWTALANGSLVRADTAGGRVTHRVRRDPAAQHLPDRLRRGPVARGHGSTWTAGPSAPSCAGPARGRPISTRCCAPIPGRSNGWRRASAVPYPFEKFDFVLAPAFPVRRHGASRRRLLQRGQLHLPRAPDAARGGSAGCPPSSMRSRTSGSATWSRCGGSTTCGSRRASRPTWPPRCWPTSTPPAARGRPSTCANKPAAYGVDQTRRHDAGVAGTRQPRPGQEQLRPDRLQQGALGPEAAQLPRRGAGVPARACSAFLDAARVRQRDVAGPAGRHRALRRGDRSTSWGRQFILRPGMPEVEQQLETAGGTVTRLALRSGPSSRCRGRAPGRCGRSCCSGGAIATRCCSRWSCRARSPTSRRRAGCPCPRLVFANAGDFGYQLTQLDSGTASWLTAGGIGRVSDPFLRAMLWGALWDQVRTARLSPGRFVEVALAALPQETDEQIAPSLLGRLNRRRRRLPGPGRARGRAGRRSERTLQGDRGRSFTAVRHPEGGARCVRRGGEQRRRRVARLGALLQADSAAGEPVRDPTRWAIVTRLLVLGRSVGGTRARAPGGAGHHAGWPAAGLHRRGGPPHRGGQAGVLRPVLRGFHAQRGLGVRQPRRLQRAAARVADPALAPRRRSTPCRSSRRNRRIFFLGRWLDAFLSGQTSPEALGVVTRWLEDHPDLAGRPPAEGPAVRAMSSSGRWRFARPPGNEVSPDHNDGATHANGAEADGGSPGAG